MANSQVTEEEWNTRGRQIPARQPRNDGPQGPVQRQSSPEALPRTALNSNQVKANILSPFLKQAFLSEPLWQEKGRVKGSFWVFYFLITSLKSITQKALFWGWQNFGSLHFVWHICTLPVHYSLSSLLGYQICCHASECPCSRNFYSS